jgi:RNA polymerase sigma-70 factor (ECF subfamily)
MQVFFARYYVPIYRFALPIVRDVTMAEDLISDVFLDVWRQAAQFEARATVSTELLAVTKYKALNAEAAHRGPNWIANRLRASDSADNLEIALQKKYSDEVLRQCVAALPPQHGQIIYLGYYHGKTVKEVAQIVGIPKSTVKTRVFYARKQLAE